MPVTYDEDDSVGTITIKGTDRLNKIDKEALADLDDAIERARDADCVVITGSGEDAFSAGGDLEYVSELSVKEAFEYATEAHRVIRQIDRHPVPVIAAINGYALGAGCQIALGCDLRVINENATIGQPEIDIGITPGFGGTQRLPRLVGEELAMRMIFLGERLDGNEAYGAGLVGEVVPDGDAYDRALVMAKEITYKPSFAVAAAKEAISQSRESSLSAGLTYEARLWSSLFGTPDQQEGMTAFLADRKPDFE